MRIVHIADSHLGVIGSTRKLTPEGWNQREEDFLRIFEIAIERIIEIHPDLVIHSGDLFHVVRPTNRVIARAAKALLRLSDGAIPMVLISGNHDAPKSRSIGSVFQIMEIISNINYVYRNSYETFRIGDAMIHAVPHCLSQDDLDRELEKARPDSNSQFNILVLHGVVSSIPEFSMNEFAEQFIPESAFRSFDYVALGHYHKFTKIYDNCYYAGSTERVSFSEEGQLKGFLEVEIPGPNVKFHELPVRSMFKLPPIDATGFDSQKLKEEIISRIGSADIDNSISRLEIKNLPEHLASVIPRQEIAGLTERALQFDIKLDKAQEAVSLTTDLANIGKLESEFAGFLSRTVVEGADKEELRILGIKYLKKIRAEETQ